ncbi:hypothetical protein [Bradyrhizobium genosp. P]|uniref:hypothetical protein n=1 Tax=Bradyrhizobium genosp. P TaxID=83641 RepID=UPI003CF265D5
MPKKSELTTQDPIDKLSPHYSSLLQRNAALRARSDELRAEIGGNMTTHVTTFNHDRVVKYSVTESLGAEAARNSNWATENQPPPKKPEPTDAERLRAEAVRKLVGDLVPEPKEEIAPIVPSWKHEARYNQIASEQAAITESLNLLAPEIERARQEHSKQVVALRAKEYENIALDIVDAALTLNSALAAQYDFVNDLRLSGVEWRRHLRTLNITAFGDLAETSSPLKMLVNDAVEKGLCDGSKIPSNRLPANYQNLI